MNQNIKIYKANKFYSLPLLITPFLLLIPLLESGLPLESRKLVGYGILSSISVILALIPIGFRLEVGEDYVKIYFLSFRLREVQAPRVKVLIYGSMLRGGLGHGKGIKGWELIDGQSKSYSIGEKFWGKEAIAHAKRVLESQLQNHESHN